MGSSNPVSLRQQAEAILKRAGLPVVDDRGALPFVLVRFTGIVQDEFLDQGIVELSVAAPAKADLQGLLGQCWEALKASGLFQPVSMDADAVAVLELEGVAEGTLTAYGLTLI